jgi:hypothetical protein
VDSPPDDLRLYYADAGLYADVVEGLTRIYFDPPGPDAANSGSMWSAPLPDRVAYVFSSLDATYPIGIHTAAVNRLAPGDAFVEDPQVERHVLMNGGVPGLGAQVVSYLTTGAAPAR